jgi:uncharacterized protein (TIGR04168 family)
MTKLAIIGDMHMQFDAADVDFFNQSDYDALLFVGDIASKNPDSLYRLLPLLNSIRKPAYLIPGNHDTTGVRQLLGELTQNNFLINFGAAAQPDRMARLRNELTGPVLCGYSAHSISDRLDLVTGRPFSMGSTNGTVNFEPYLRREYGVSTLEQSADKITSLIEACNPSYLLLAHHGPHGLGQRATDMFGADFLPHETDFGDRDLTSVVERAVASGKPPVAVIAGHMHYPTKHGKKPKQWYLRRDGILYVNAARWPRIFTHADKLWHHHVCLEVGAEKPPEVYACYVSGDSTVMVRDDRANTPH